MSILGQTAFFPLPPEEGLPREDLAVPAEHGRRR
jgi:hypothetical protein